MGNPKPIYRDVLSESPRPDAPRRGAGVRDYHFDTVDYGVGEQFDRFRAEMDKLEQVDLLPGVGKEGGFPASRKGWALNSLRIHHLSSQGRAFARTQRDIASSGLDGWMFLLPRGGWGVVEINGHVRTLGPGHLELRPLTVPYRGYITDGDTLGIYLHRGTFPGSAGLFDRIATDTWPQPFHPLLASYIRNLLMQVDMARHEEKGQLEASIVAMVKACLTLSKEDLALAEHQVKSTRLEIARRFIDANLSRPDLGPETVRAVLAVSRRHLYDIFEPHGGIATYIRQRRLAAAHAAISNPRERRLIGEVAHALGMHDQGQFSRQFRAEFGYSPSEAREAVAASAHAGGFARWLRTGTDTSDKPVTEPQNQPGAGAGDLVSRVLRAVDEATSRSK